MMAILVLAASVWFMGCSAIRLQTTTQVDTKAWQQYGGTMERRNIATTTLIPPLSLSWMVDASAGFSEFSAVVADSVLFLGTLQGDIYAIQVRTGQEMGSYDFGSPIVGAPVVEGTMLYVAVTNTEASLFAYDLAHGRIVWKARVGAIETSPLLIAGKLYVTTLDGEVYCIDKTSGAIVWKFLTPLFEQTAFLHSSPASDGNAIVFGCDNGSVYCISADSGKLLWQTKTKKSVFSSPSICNGKVFFGSQDENFYALDLNNGKVLWKQQLGSKIFSSQAVNESYVYVGASSGEVFCLNAKSGEITWKYQAQSPISAAPIVSGNVVYVGSLDRNLYAFDAQKGELLWKYTTEARIKSMPVLWNGYLILPLDNRMVLGFKQETGR